MAWLDQTQREAQAALRPWQGTISRPTRGRCASRAISSTPSATSIKLEYPDINTAVGISGPAFPMNASDRLWAKYQLGERAKIVDPTTKQPAVRNIFYDDGSEISVKAMQARGTIFWQCNVALGGVAQQLADAIQLPVAGRAGRSDCRTEPGRAPDALARDGARARPGARLHLHEAVIDARSPRHVKRGA